MLGAGCWVLGAGCWVQAGCMSRGCVHESVTVGTSDVDEPGMMPAVCELEGVLSVAASGTDTGTASVAKNAGVAIYGVTMAPQQQGAWMARRGTEGTQAPNPRAELYFRVACVYGQRFPGRRAGRSARTRC